MLSNSLCSLDDAGEGLLQYLITNKRSHKSIPQIPFFQTAFSYAFKAKEARVRKKEEMS